MQKNSVMAMCLAVALMTSCSATEQPRKPFANGQDFTNHLVNNFGYSGLAIQSELDKDEPRKPHWSATFTVPLDSGKKCDVEIDQQGGELSRAIELDEVGKIDDLTTARVGVRSLQNLRYTDLRTALQYNMNQRGTCLKS